MPKSGLVIGGLVLTFCAVIGSIELGALKVFAGDESVSIERRQSDPNEDLIATESGWRYLRGQPSHWKYLMMHK